jgi:hypothetical protein
VSTWWRVLANRRADYATRVRTLYGVADLDGNPLEPADEEPQGD